MGMAKPTDSALFTELWIEYAIAMLALALRFFSRWRMFGLKNFDLGDAFAGLAMVMYSLGTVGIYLVTLFGNNIGLDEATAMQVPDDKLPRMILGSKLAVINWYWYITLLWSLKGVLLMVYVKLGTGIDRQEWVVRGVCASAIVSYVASILCHTLVCTPPWKGWQVKPYPGDSCTMRRMNYIVIAIMNGVSDLAIIAVPMPILFRVKVQLSRKLVLVLLFSLGFFCIIATILRAYYSLLSLETLSVALGWTSRETCIGTIVACAPGIKPLFSTSRWYRSNGSRSRDKAATPDGSHYLPFSKKDTPNPGSKFDGQITVSRSVDVYRSENRQSIDSPYGVEMARWKSKGQVGSLDSDERVIIEHPQDTMTSRSHNSHSSHKSAQYSLREFFMSENARSKH
ncbi:hypothetical protein CKM354_000202500 [Cercospora kikuchii]|uniref:Rhodopsin domain-containing protein n=1 Tax=Cercospora kikuchii TaxID=84275 RepID=A0A9P3F983_9PEZI|nr:uncharacterized protein CKM354_000202500 [Cercospora kikuchii]GIZ38613.1 hypothetical protein CKM354_000202500 [Cercospora kikuchii]